MRIYFINFILSINDKKKWGQNLIMKMLLSLNLNRYKQA